MQKLRKGKVFIKNWGAGIGSNAYRDCFHLVVFGLFHPNSEGLKTGYAAHSNLDREAMPEDFGFKALKIARDNHHTRWIVQMLNRIRIRKMLSDGRDLGMYTAQVGNIVWIIIDKDQTIAEDVLLKNFRGATIQREEVHGDAECKVNVSKRKTVESKVTYILSKLEGEGCGSIDKDEILDRFGW